MTKKLEHVLSLLAELSDDDLVDATTEISNIQDDREDRRYGSRDEVVSLKDMSRYGGIIKYTSTPPEPKPISAEELTYFEQLRATLQKSIFESLSNFPPMPPAPTTATQVIQATHISTLTGSRALGAGCRTSSKYVQD